MRKLIKRIFDLYEYQPKPNYEEFTLQNLSIYLTLHKTVTGESLESIKVSPQKYLEYCRAVEGFTTIAYKGLPVLPNGVFKIIKSKGGK